MKSHDKDSMSFLNDGQGEPGEIGERNPDEYPKTSSRVKAKATTPGPDSTLIKADELEMVEPPPTLVVDDPFSPENLAISQDFGGMTETKRLLTTVRVGKPNKESWVRTSPDTNHWIVGSVLELKSDGDETYWLLPKIRDALIGEPCLKAVRLILAVDRQGNPFFWKVGMPDPNGRSQPWVDSMMDAVNLAQTKWVRVAWSMSTRGYELTVAEIKADPKWPVEPLSDLLNIAFRGRVVSTMEHPILRTLRGQD